MQPVRMFFRRCREFFFKEKFDADMAEQIRLHLELTSEENIKKGMSPEEARYAAMRKFGGVEQMKEIAREQSGWLWLEQLAKDFKFSFRALGKAPAFTLTVVIILALCIGANTVIGSALYSMLLKPLPFRQPAQLIEVYNQLPNLGTEKAAVSLAQYLDYKENADLFDGLGINTLWTFTIGEETEAMRFVGARVSPDYFEFWGLKPYRGRFFDRANSVPGNTRVVVLAQSFWENYFHADPDIVGKLVRISGEQWTVLGVAPRAMESIDGRTVAFIPTTIPGQLSPASRTAQEFLMYARLKPRVAIAQGLAQLQALEGRFLNTAPAPLRAYVERTGYRMGGRHIREEQMQQFKTSLWLLEAGVAIVLVLGSVNAANLVLARFNARQTEISIRRALGASRSTLARGILIEAFLLALIGAVIGLAGGWAAIRVMTRYIGSGDGYDQYQIALDPVVVAASFACAVGVAVVICLIPAWEIWRGKNHGAQSVQELQGARSATGARRTRRLSGMLVTIQVAIALVLLISAGLLVRSMTNLLAVDLGFPAEKIIFGRMQIGPAYQGDKGSALHDRILDRVRAIPGVESAALTANVLMDSLSNAPFPITIRRTVSNESADQPRARIWAVSPDFFATMDIRLVEGRAFTDADRGAAIVPLIVDRTLAERHFPGRSAIGENLVFGALPANEGKWPVIVGVVERARLNGAADFTGLPSVYTPLRAGNVTLVLRSSRPAGDVLKAVRQEIRSVERAVPFYWAGTLEERHLYHLRHRRGSVVLAGSFGTIALLLSAVGLYGMLAYDVSLRTREIGIRGAVGANRSQIIGLILRQGVGKAGIGILVGLIGAFVVTRFMRSVLFGVEPTDPASFIIVSLFLFVVAMFASYLPARHAARVNPVIALRAE